jgi:hypothetical protein
MWKRRMLQFTKGSKEIMLILIILLFPLMEVIFISVIMNGIQTIIKNNDPGSRDDISSTVIGNAFPILVLLGILFSQGAFILTSVKDKEDKLRYLLNFAGMNSFSYWVGMFLADIILYIIPISLLIIMSFILSIKEFSDNAGLLFLAFVIFGYPYITSIYLSGFLFSKTESAFKYGLLVVMLVTAIMLIPGIWITHWLDFVVHANPIVCTYIIVSNIMVPNSWDYDQNILMVMLIVQGTVMMAAVIGLDMWLQRYFKGLDHNQQTIERPQMDENQDVIEQKNFASNLWNNDH